MRVSTQVVATRKKLRHPVLQSRVDSRTKLRHECKQIEEERLRIDNLLTMIRSQISKEVQSVAMNFYSECLHCAAYHNHLKMQDTHNNSGASSNPVNS